MAHPSHGDAWKHFDRTHPSFASDARNVRLGLCTDGFSPFGNSSPKSPGKIFDVFLRPLIDELKILWTSGVQTYDVCNKQNFNMRAALLWTITDFPAHAMQSGWSTHGWLACPYCMDMTKSFNLRYGRKASWFYCHRQFLPLDHPYRKQAYKFHKGRIENDQPPIRLSGEEVRQRVEGLPDITFGKPADGTQPIDGDICSTVLRVEHMEQLEKNIVEILCKFEKIFPPGFFDSIEHLPILLAYEAKISPPLEEKNRARVEASIVEAYMIGEVSTFCSAYFESHVSTRLNRVLRNDDGGPVDPGNLFISTHPGRPLGSRVAIRYLDVDELKAAHRYVLLNHDKIDPYLLITDMELDIIRYRDFPQWLLAHAEEVNSVEFEALRHAMDSYPTRIGDEEHDEEEEFEEIESEEDSQDDEDHNSSDSDKDDDMEIDD
ncbi:UNVERIFIED_CONTAM: hypothetical protein Scaly_2998100 [Sesamum calycinum]|uniref:DUF4218 domain-containing protein n=1 Tax=Sesamum calycinum TaxID=2727403 RepID=A0AAW2KGV7_9LAMI